MSPRKPVLLVQPFWAVQIESDALEHLDALAARRGLTREQAVRDAVTWWTARASLWELRTQRLRADRIAREAETFDPITAFLALERGVHPPGGSSVTEDPRSSS